MIIDQFRDFKEDLEEVTREKLIYEQNDKFVMNSLKNEKFRKMIAHNYNLVIQ